MRKKIIYANRWNLSDFELLLLGLFADGATRKTAAKTLDVAPSTIGDYLKEIFKKMNLHSITSAVFLVEREGLLKGIV